MEKNINSNMTGLYFEDNMGIFEKRTYYPRDYDPDTDTKYMSELLWNENWEDNMPPRLFWNSSLMRDPFTTDAFTTPKLIILRWEKRYSVQVETEDMYGNSIMKKT